MKVNCKFCGAAVDTSMKICPGCGKILPTYRKAEKSDKPQFASDSASSGLAPGSDRPVKTGYASTRSAREMKGAEELRSNGGPSKDYDPVAAAKQHRSKFNSNPSSGKENGSALVPLLGKLIKIVIILAVIAAAYAFIRVMMVRQAGYDFKLDKDIRLASSNYGDAFSNYFEDGKWWFEFKSNSVTYKGTAPDGSEYEMLFGKDGSQTVVRQLYIDGKMVQNKDNNIMKNYILSAFMATKERRGGPTAMGQVDIK